jgi:hypothetical protein
MQKIITINDKTYTLLKRVSSKVISDICKWKDLLEADLVSIENEIVYFYKVVSYDEEVENAGTTTVPGRKRNKSNKV